jgi:hypothetical protein
MNQDRRQSLLRGRTHQADRRCEAAGSFAAVAVLRRRYRYGWSCVSERSLAAGSMPVLGSMTAFGSATGHIWSWRLLDVGKVCHL